MMNSHFNKTWHDIVIERGVLFLLIFTPLALAGVPIWASSIMQMVAFALFGVWLLKASSEETIFLKAGTLLKLYGLFLVVVAVQLVAMPLGLLEILSPGSAAIYRSVENLDPGRWHPISVYPQATLNELLNYFAYGAVFLIVSDSAKRREQILLFARTIVTMGCFMLVIALLQKAFWNGRIYWFYPIDPALESRLSYIWGPYINRNHFAGYLEMAIPIALGLLMYTLSRIRHRKGKTVLYRVSLLAAHHKLPAFALLVVAFVCMSGALFATLSRGAILAFSASMTVFIIMMRSRRSLRSKVWIFVILAFIVATVGLFAALDRIEERFMDLAIEDRIMRTQIWSDMTALVRDYPFLGSGAGTFDRAFTRYQTRYSTVLFEHAENDYLEELSDTGFLGLSLAFAAGSVFFMTMVKTWRGRKNSFSTCIGAGGIASCAAIAVHSLTDFNLRVPANALLLSVISGLTVACLVRTQTEGTVSEPIRDRHTVRGIRSMDISSEARSL